MPRSRYVGLLTVAAAIVTHHFVSVGVVGAPVDDTLTGLVGGSPGHVTPPAPTVSWPPTSSPTPETGLRGAVKELLPDGTDGNIIVNADMGFYLAPGTSSPQLVKTRRSTRRGGFRVRLPPGQYLVQVTHPDFYPFSVTATVVDTLTRTPVRLTRRSESPTHVPTKAPTSPPPWIEQIVEPNSASLPVDWTDFISIACNSDCSLIAATTKVPLGSIWISRSGTWEQHNPCADSPTCDNSLPRLFNAVASSASGINLVATEGPRVNDYTVPPLERVGRIFVSHDSGREWTAVAQFATDQKPWSAVTSSADGVYLAAATGTRSSPLEDAGSIWTSADSGATWIESFHLTTTHQMPYIAAITSSSDGSKLTAVEYRDGSVMTSTDFGSTWRKKYVTVGSGQWDSAMQPAYGCGGCSGGTTSSEAIPHAATWSSVAMSDDGTKIVAVQKLHPGIWKSTDGGISWNHDMSMESTVGLSSPTPWNSGWTSVACSSSCDHLILAARTIGGPTWTRSKLLTSNDFGNTYRNPYSETEGIFGRDYTKWSGVDISEDGQGMVACVSNRPTPYESLTPTNRANIFTQGV